MSGIAGNLWESGQIAMGFLHRVIEHLASFLPNLLGALLLLLIGWILAKTLSRLTSRVLRVRGMKEFSHRIRLQPMLDKLGIRASPDELMGGFVYYIVLLLFFVSASEVLGFTVILKTLSHLMHYLPHVLGAALILLIALYLARMVKDGLTSASSTFQLAYAGGLSALVEMLIIGFGIVLALTELGLDISIVTANFTIIISGIVLALSLSIGLGSRSIMANVLARYYVAQLYQIGDHVSLLGLKGSIVGITPVSVIIKTAEADILHIPNERIISEGSRNPLQPTR